MSEYKNYRDPAQFLERLAKVKKEANDNCSFKLCKKGQKEYEVTVKGKGIDLLVCLRENAQAITMEEITDSINPAKFNLIKMEPYVEDEPDANLFQKALQFFHIRPNATGSTLSMEDFTWAATTAKPKSLHLSCVDFICGINDKADEGICLSNFGTAELSEVKFENCVFSSQVLTWLLKETFKKVDKLIFERCVFLSDCPRKIEIKFDHTEVGSLQFLRPYVSYGGEDYYCIPARNCTTVVGEKGAKKKTVYETDIEGNNECHHKEYDDRMAGTPDTLSHLSKTAL
ncbi:hypothetical protein [Parasitella parasitica]|uniref:Uncharacterized protein n=1 Tax=Parasitella parasitica TaxID=35722 RepID=A0A0B7MWT5_9FUNG|nr:hypothetical protein [Parasitella parasitica]